MSAEGSGARFALLAFGVWISFLVFGFTQEHLTRHGYGQNNERFTHTQALVVAQSIGNVIVSGCAIALMNTEKGKGVSKWTGGVPVKDWLIVAISYFLAHSLGMASLKYIIYPMQVVIKSCKAVPVMIGEIIFARVRPSLAKSVGVILLSAGVALFTFSSENGQKHHHASGNVLYGAGLAIGALIFDAVYGPYQNKIVAKSKPSSWILMFNMNLYELVIAVVYDLITSTELQGAWGFWEKYPVEFGYRVIMFCVSISIGNVFIYKIQREFGALAVTKTTTVRKFVSLAISIVWFGHTLGISHYLAMALVFAAPVLEQRISRLETKKTDSVDSAQFKKND
jgi:UDP-galactose transporter B1